MKKAKQGDQKAKLALVKNFRPSIRRNVKIAAYNSPSHQEDLEGEGVLAVLNAIKKFSLDEGRDFTPYVKKYIKGTILNKLKKLLFQIKAPQDVLSVYNKLKKNDLLDETDPKKTEGILGNIPEKK